MDNYKFKIWEDEWNFKSDTLNFRDSYFKTLDEVLNFLRKIYKDILNDKSDFDVLNEIGCFNSKTKGSVCQL